MFDWRLLQVEEQEVPTDNRKVHWQLYRTNRDSLASIHELIHQMEIQGVISKTHSPFNSHIWPLQKSDRGWRLTVDYCGLNKVMPPLSATFNITNAFSILLAAERMPQFAFSWNQLPQGWKLSSTICHRLIQAALEQGDAPQTFTVHWWHHSVGEKAEAFEKGDKIIQILLKAAFAIRKSKVKGPAQKNSESGSKMVVWTLSCTYGPISPYFPSFT